MALYVIASARSTSLAPQPGQNTSEPLRARPQCVQ
jgi:hypothetical protein